MRPAGDLRVRSVYDASLEESRVVRQFRQPVGDQSRRSPFGRSHCQPLVVEQSGHRVLQLLIERIDYDGGTGKLQISWRLAGFGQLAEEVGS